MSYWKDVGIAHNEPSLWLGNFQGFKTTRSFGDCVRDTYEQFKGTGPFCGFYFFQRPAVVVLELDLVKSILIKDFSNFIDLGIFHNERDDPLTGHVFLLDDSKWKNLRQKLSPTFTSGKMKFMYPSVIKVAEEFIKVMDHHLKTSPVVEIRELLARFTTDVVGTCAFGIDCNSLKDPQAEFRLMGKRSRSERRHGGLFLAFMQGFPKLACKLHMKQTPDDITAFYMRIVRETVAYREANKIQRNDFLNILMDLKNDQQSGKVIKFSIEEMAAQIFVFLWVVLKPLSPPWVLLCTSWLNIKKCKINCATKYIKLLMKTAV